MTEKKITEHFHLDEFDCHDGQPVPPGVVPSIYRLCTDVLEVIRVEWGGPILITSGWRSQKHNQAVGGAPQSTHLTGKGADIRPVYLARVPHLTLTIERLISQGKLPTLGGLGLYKGWLHVDIRQRPQGRQIARWHGSGLGSEQV